MTNELRGEHGDYVLAVGTWIRGEKMYSRGGPTSQ